MKIMILAGEESGVIYANKLRAEFQGAEVRGYGDYGFKTADLAVFGFFAVVKKIGYFLNVNRTMRRAIREWRPDVVITIDYPGLNLKLAAYAKSLGIRAVHVVCPQAWAWHKNRIPKIERALDALCCFFPFEPKLFRPGFAVFTGHPLADEMRGETAAEEDREKGLLAILPGSRIGEIERILPRLLSAVDLLKVDGLKVRIPAANIRARKAIERVLAENGGANRPGAVIEVTDGGAVELLRRAECAAVASGTATLQAALVRCPTVLVYAVGEILARFLKYAIKGVKHVGLANIIAEKAGAECPMPELLQWDFTSEAAANYLRGWLTDSEARKLAEAKLSASMKLLESDGNAIKNIVEVALRGVR